MAKRVKSKRAATKPKKATKPKPKTKRAKPTKKKPTPKKPTRKQSAAIRAAFAARSGARAAIAARPPPPVVPSNVPANRRALVKALELAHLLAIEETPCTLAIRGAPPPQSARGILWDVIGRYRFTTIVGYIEAGMVVSRWRDSRRLARLINPQRLARIVVTFERVDPTDPDTRFTGEYTLGEATPWSFCVERAYGKIFINNVDRYGRARDSLVEAYGQGPMRYRTRVTALYIVLAQQIGVNASGRLRLAP